MENPRTHRFHDLGIWGTCPWLPKPTIFIFGDTKILQLIQEKRNILLGKTMSGNLKQTEIRPIPNFREDKDRTIPKIPLIFSKVLHMRSIPIQKHEMGIWWNGINVYQTTCNVNWIIWDQSQSKSMNYNCCDMASISSAKIWNEFVKLWSCQTSKLQNLHTLEIWNFVTLKLWNQETEKSRNQSTWESLSSVKGIPPPLNIPTPTPAPAHRIPAQFQAMFWQLVPEYFPVRVFNEWGNRLRGAWRAGKWIWESQEQNKRTSELAGNGKHNLGDVWDSLVFWFLLCGKLI